MEKENKKIKKAFKAAFPKTIPILTGFIFLGMAYGIYMNAFGFNFLYPMFMSLIIFGGSTQFVTVGLLMGTFDPVNAFVLTLMINARHLFYGISMLEKYRVPGIKRFFLIFGMCDETFSVNYAANIPEDIDKGWFMFFVTLLNYIYWALGSTLGGIFGGLVEFNTKGLEFVMTAMFVVIFTEQWLKEDNHSSFIIGLLVSVVCLVIFGSGNFIIPTMVLILLTLTLLRTILMKAGELK
ncbi:MAG: branched-chain amino acid transporter AzlC [Tissierellia bacterium]|nr:branched-chain amino acid transporter AzlC [Tissierellia bacterium]